MPGPWDDYAGGDSATLTPPPAAVGAPPWEDYQSAPAAAQAAAPPWLDYQADPAGGGIVHRVLNDAREAAVTATRAVANLGTAALSPLGLMSPEEKARAAEPALTKRISDAYGVDPALAQTSDARFLGGRTNLIPVQALPAHWVGLGEQALGARIGGPVGQAIGAAGGMAEGTANVTSGVTSAENLAMLPLIPEGIGGKLVAGVFLGKQIAATPEQWKQLQAAPTTAEKARLVTEMGLGYALPAMAFAHGGGAKGEAASDFQPTGLADVRVPNADKGEPAPVESAAPVTSADAAPVAPAPELRVLQVPGADGQSSEIPYTLDRFGYWTTEADRPPGVSVTMNDDLFARTQQRLLNPEPAPAETAAPASADAIAAAPEEQAPPAAPVSPEPTSADAITPVPILPDAIPPAADAPIESNAARQARQDYENEQRQALDFYNSNADAGGRDLLTAVNDLGGIPSHLGRDAQVGPFRGELKNLYEMSRGGGDAGGYGVFAGRLFNKKAGPIDQLVQSLRAEGFPLETPDDLFSALDMRMRTGQPFYSRPESPHAMLQETPSPTRLHDFVDTQSIPPELKQEAAHGISRTLQLAADPRLARAYESNQGELFHDPAAPATARAPSVSHRPRAAALASRAGFDALKTNDPARLRESLDRGGGRISTILHQVVTREIPKWDIRGSRIESPADLAMAAQAIRSPYFESLKAVLMNKDGEVKSSHILTVGSIDQTVAHPRELIGWLQGQKPAAGDRVSILHNHPSGDPTPSAPDQRVTADFRKAVERTGTRFESHIITNGNRYAVIARNGDTTFHALPEARLAPWELQASDLRPQIQDPADLGALVSTLRNANPDAAHIAYLSTKNHVIGIERITGTSTDLQRALIRGVGREGAYGVAVDLAPHMTGENSGLAGARQAAKDAGAHFIDATWEGVPSAREAGLLGDTPAPYPAEDNFHSVREEPPSQGSFEEAANDERKMRGHIATVQRMVDASPDVKSRVASWYEATENSDVNQRANAGIDQLGLERATMNFLADKNPDVNSFATGRFVAERLDKLGRFDDAAAVRNHMAEAATTPAQVLQYISTIAKTSPEGLIKEAQKIVTDQIKSDPAKQKLLEHIQRLQSELAGIKDDKTRDASTKIVIQNLAKVNQPGERLTGSQVQKLLQQHAAGKLDAQALGDALAKFLKVPKLSADNIAKIRQAQQTWAQTTDPIMKLRRGAEMMDSVHGLVPRSLWDKVRATATISMILHGRLPVKIGVSNMLQLVGQTLVDSVNAITVDPLISIIATGKRTVTGPQLKARLSGLAAPVEAFRAGTADASARGLGAYPTFKEGMRTMLDMAAMTTRGIQDMQDMNGRGIHIFSSRFGKLAEDTVTLVHNIVPYAFWNAGYKASIARQLAAARVDVPTAEMVTNARLDANKAIFQNDTAAAAMLKDIRKVLDYPTAKVTDGKYGVGTATLPFAKVPGALLTEGATWSPLGFVRAGYEVFRPMFGEREPFRQKDFADALTKSVIGTGALVYTGYWLAKLGIISRAPDENKNVEAMRKATGWGQYRFNASELKRRFLSGNFTTPSRDPIGQDGDATYSYSWLEPVAFPLAMGADIHHSQDKREIDLKRGKITGNAAVLALAAGAQTLTDNSMMQGVQRLATDYAERGGVTAALNTLANVPGNFVPSLARQTAQLLDNTVRETRAGSQIDALAARLAVQMPGMSEKYPPRYDVLGQAVQRYNYGQNSVLNVFFNPAQPQQLRNTAAVNEMMRLYDASGDGRIIPGQVQRNITVNGKQLALDNQQLATYQRYVGQLSAAGVARLFASPMFAAESMDQKLAAIAQTLSGVHTAAKIDLFHQESHHVDTRGNFHQAPLRAYQQMNSAHALGLTPPAAAENPVK